MHPGFPALNLIILFLKLPNVIHVFQMYSSLFSFSKNTQEESSISCYKAIRAATLWA